MMKPFHTDGGKLTGGYIPRPLAKHLGVAAVYLQTNRSRILLELITKYLKTLPDITEMVRKIAEEEFNHWQRAQGDKPPYKEYRREVLKTLMVKRVDPNYSQHILEQMDKLYESSKGSGRTDKKARNKKKNKTA